MATMMEIDVHLQGKHIGLFRDEEEEEGNSSDWLHMDVLACVCMHVSACMLVCVWMRVYLCVCTRHCSALDVKLYEWGAEARA